MMMSLHQEASDLLKTLELIRDTPVDVFFKAHLKHTASMCHIMGKSEIISQNINETIVDLHKSGSSMGAISRCLKVPFTFSNN